MTNRPQTIGILDGKVEGRALQAFTGPSGGYLIQDQMLDELIEAEIGASCMRQICRTVPPISGESMPVPVQDAALADAEGHHLYLGAGARWIRLHLVRRARARSRRNRPRTSIARRRRRR